MDMATSRMLLSVIIKSVPFEPKMSDLKKAADIKDDRTLKDYLSKLDDAGLNDILPDLEGRGILL